MSRLEINFEYRICGCKGGQASHPLFEQSNRLVKSCFNTISSLSFSFLPCFAIFTLKYASVSFDFSKNQIALKSDLKKTNKQTKTKTPFMEISGSPLYRYILGQLQLIEETVRRSILFLVSLYFLLLLLLIFHFPHQILSSAFVRNSMAGVLNVLNVLDLDVQHCKAPKCIILGSKKKSDVYHKILYV